MSEYILKIQSNTHVDYFLTLVFAVHPGAMTTPLKPITYNTCSMCVHKYVCMYVCSMPVFLCQREREREREREKESNHYKS